MKLYRLSIIIILGTLLSGCSSIVVKTDYDRTVDFSRYHTYRWIDQKPRPPRKAIRNKKLTEQRIKRAVEQNLLAKGLQKQDFGKPDFLIAYHIAVQNKVDIDRYGYGTWRHRRVVTEVHHYKEGTLVVDFVDPKTNQLFWRGWASGILAGQKTTEAQIIKAVTKMLEKYPPR